MRVTFERGSWAGVIIGALLAFSIYSCATPDDNRLDDLTKKVDELSNKVLELSEKVEDLEDDKPAAPGGKTPDEGNTSQNNKLKHDQAEIERRDVEILRATIKNGEVVEIPVRSSTANR